MLCELKMLIKSQKNVKKFHVQGKKWVALDTVIKKWVTMLKILGNPG